MLNQRLREARDKKLWSIGTAAEKAGVSWPTYSRWEHGETNPHPYNLAQLCEAFGKSPEELGFAHLVKKSKSGETADLPTLPSQASQDAPPLTVGAEQVESPFLGEKEQAEFLAAATPEQEAPLETPGRLAGEASSLLASILEHRDSPAVIISRRQLLQDMLVIAHVTLLTPPYEVLNPDALERLAFTLHKPASPDMRALTDLNDITNGIWRARMHGIAAPDLLSSSLGHFQTIIYLLKHSQSLRTRQHLCSVARNAGQLMGHLLFDIRDFPTAWSYYTFALSAAQGARQPDEEAAVLGLMSFVLTYKTDPAETPPETVTLLEQAQHLTLQSRAIPLRASLSAAKAEIHANLGQRDAYQKEIDRAQGLVMSLGEHSDAVPDDMFNFTRARFAGYQGACLLRIGKPEEALNILQASMQEAGKIHSIKLIHIGVAHAQLGVYSQACAFGHQALARIAQTKRSSQFQCVQDLRRELSAWAHTSEVKDFDHHLETVQKTLIERSA